MRNLKYFFDTYALYEIASGNKNYMTYYKNYNIMTFKFNLIELFYNILRDNNIDIAKEYYNELSPFIIEFNDKIIVNAMVFKLEHRDKRLSYVDCLGYIYAKENNLLFLTGDKQFKDFPNVKFVK